MDFMVAEQPDNPIGPPPLTPAVTSITSATSNVTDPINGGGIGGRTSIFAGVFASSPAVISNADPNPPQPITSGSHPDWVDNPPSTATAITIVEPTSLTLSTSLFLSCRSSGSSIFQDHPTHYLPSPQLQPQPAAMSATALLQKAAQMGVTGSNASLFRGFGLSMSSSHGQDTAAAAAAAGISMTAGLGLGLNSDLTDLMMGQSAAFGTEPTTRDLLGLGIGGSALFTSFGGGSCDVDAASPYGGGGSG